MHMTVIQSEGLGWGLGAGGWGFKGFSEEEEE